MKTYLVCIQNIFLSGLLLLILLAAAPVKSENIDGFRDLKFGMTEKEVSALEACSSSSECIYELLGKNRYLHPLYRNSTSSNSPSSHSNDQNQPKLARITIDMGAFNDQFYGELQGMLLDSYNLTRDLTEKEMNAFVSGRTSELVSEYENGAVLLKVVRRKFGNLVLKVIYQTSTMAKETKKQISASK